jgi:hypothetical protein
MTTSTPESQIREADARSEERWAYSVGIQNYVFGLPLVIFERERALRLDPAAIEKAKRFAPAAPVNQIGHMTALATADTSCRTRPTTTPSTAAVSSNSATVPSS